MFVGCVGHNNSSRLTDALEPRGDIDFVAHQVAVGLLHHVAEMNADAKLNALVRRDPSVAFDHSYLDFDGAADCVDDAAELDDLPSPVRLTTRPWCTAMVGSIRSLRSARSRARIRSSSALVSRE